MTAMESITKKSNGHIGNVGSVQNSVYYKIPVSVFAAVRQIIGQLPHDQVGPICAALDECAPLEE